MILVFRIRSDPAFLGQPDLYYIGYTIIFFYLSIYLSGEAFFWFLQMWNVAEPGFKLIRNWTLKTELGTSVEDPGPFSADLIYKIRIRILLSPNLFKNLVTLKIND